MINDPSLFASFLIGTILPVLIAFILHQQAPDSVKAIIAFVVCCIFAALTMWLTDKLIGTPLGLSLNDKAKLYVENAGLILMTAWGFYARFWSQLGITQPLNNAGLKVGRPTTTP